MTGLLQKAIPEAVKHAAEARAEQLEWPTPKDEEWRRTDITDFPFDSYQPYDETVFPQSSENLTDEKPDSDRPELGRPQLAFEEGYALAEIFLEGGRIRETRLDDELSQSGVEIISIHNAGDRSLTGFEPMLLDTVAKAENRLEAWQFQGNHHGIAVTIPSGVKLAKPIYLHLHEIGDGVLSKPNLVVDIGPEAVATIARVIQTGNSSLLLSPGIIARVGDAAHLDLITIDDYGPKTSSFSYTAIETGRDSRLRHIVAQIGGALAKSRITVTLGGAGGEAYIDGVYLAGEGEHIDLKSVQEHLAPNTMSRSYFKGAVKDSGRTIYQGLIDVDGVAKNTDAYLTNKNLVLNDGARADSIPSLKIRTNDVKCSHGSTTGRIDEEQIFYLMNRGFTRRQAKSAIVEGYFEDALKQLDQSLRTAVVDAMVHRLGDKGGPYRTGTTFDGLD